LGARSHTTPVMATRTRSRGGSSAATQLQIRYLRAYYWISLFCTFGDR